MLQRCIQTKKQQNFQFLETFLCRDFPGGEGVVPRFLLSPLEVGLDSALLRPALGILRSCFRIFETLFQIDSFLFPDLGLESEQDFESVSKRAVERIIVAL